MYCISYSVEKNVHIHETQIKMFIKRIVSKMAAMQVKLKEFFNGYGYLNLKFSCKRSFLSTLICFPSIFKALV